MVLVTKRKPKNTIHDKRRAGQHHQPDKRYHDTYWPYLPLALIVTMGVVFSGILGNVQNGVKAYATNMSIAGLVQSTNAHRAGSGLGALALNAQLNSAAQAKANDMVTRDYWSHDTPEGNPPWVFFTAAGYPYLTAGENLAYGFATSEDALVGWMNSPGHKANVLNTSYKEVGFGIANSPDYQSNGNMTVVVAMYGSQAVAAAPAPIPAAPTKPAATPPAPTPVAAEPTPVADEPIPVEPDVVVAEETSNQTEDATPVVASDVSRIELIAGTNSSWSMFAVSVIATVAIAIFFLRHGLFWHRTLVKGERFLIRHKFLDVALIATAVIGFVLTRSAGVIH